MRWWVGFLQRQRLFLRFQFFLVFGLHERLLSEVDIDKQEQPRSPHAHKQENDDHGLAKALGGTQLIRRIERVLEIFRHKDRRRYKIGGTRLIQDGLLGVTQELTSISSTRIGGGRIRIRSRHSTGADGKRRRMIHQGT